MVTETWSEGLGNEAERGCAPGELPTPVLDAHPTLRGARQPVNRKVGDHPKNSQLPVTILATAAEDSRAHIGDRSPVIVPRGLLGGRLDSGIAGKDAVLPLVEASGAGQVNG